MSGTAGIAIVRALSSRALRVFACGAGVLVLTSCSVIVNTKDRAGCSASSECTSRFGEPSACVDAQCVELLTPECHEVWPAGALSQSNVMLVGFMGDLAAGKNAYGTPTKEGAQAALQEIEKQANGLPPPSNSPALQRHLAMLICDHGSDPSSVARHLVNDVKVPVIIGDSYSSVTLKIFDEVAHPAGVLVLSPSATSPALTDHDDDGLLWRTTPSDIVQAEALKFLVADVEQALQTQKLLAPGQKAKVSMPTKRDSAGLGLAQAVTQVNPAFAHPAPKVSAVSVPYDDPATTAVDWQSAINQVLTKPAPDIVFPMGTTEFVTSMMQGIEDGWDPSGPRPWYVFPEGDRFDGLSQLVHDNPNLALNQRIIGAAPGARSSPLYQAFEVSFELTFDDHHPPGNLAEFGYDAAYLVAYAIAIANTVAPNGRELADALTHVSCKDKTVGTPGAQDLNQYLKAARDDGCIDYEGASGPLDFDPRTGEALSDIGLWCVRHKGDGSYGFDPLLDSYYSVNDGVIVDKKDPLDLTVSGWCADAGP